MSEQFSMSEAGEEINLRHMISLDLSGVATLIDGRRVKMLCCDMGPSAVIRPVVTIPAARGALAVVFLKDGSWVHSPIIAWKIVGGTAIPITPDIGGVVAVAVQSGQGLLCRGRWFSSPGEVSGLLAEGSLRRYDAEIT